MEYLAKFCVAYLDSCEPNEDILRIESMRFLPSRESNDNLHKPPSNQKEKTEKKDYNILFSTTKGKFYALRYSQNFKFK